MRERKSHQPWHAHRNCVICGHQNALGLKVKFHEVAEGEVEADWKVTERVQGYAGLLQGGVTAALLDSAMVNALRHSGVEAFTAEMTVRYLQAIPVGSKLHIIGKIVRSRRNLHWTEAQVMMDGIVVASAEAKFLDIPQG